MEYIVKNCPKCEGELHIPSNLKNCICMFCGEAFDLQETKSSEIQESTRLEVEKDYRAALENISSLTENYEQQLKLFTREKYVSSFEEYVQSGTLLLVPVERYATMSGDNVEKVLEETAQTLIEVIEKEIANVKGGMGSSAKTKMIDKYRFLLTVYTIPMICYLKYDISEPLADLIIEKWRIPHPQFAFFKGNFENLKSGFERKGFCFITTAVCETLDKADDCTELTAFRSFRDNYMQETQERQALVEEYYQIAPVIVASINMRLDKNETYHSIWQEYLQPCLKDINEKSLYRCEERYTRMVRELRKEYDIINS